MPSFYDERIASFSNKIHLRTPVEIGGDSNNTASRLDAPWMTVHERGLELNMPKSSMWGRIKFIFDFIFTGHGVVFNMNKKEKERLKNERLIRKIKGEEVERDEDLL